MGAYSGTVTQPSTGRRVAWTLAPGLAKLGRQLDKLGITWYSIGDVGHLKRKGGHTPWKPGAPFGTVTAIDVMASPYAVVERGILRLMKQDNYDTTWIDFINTNGSQYDWNGRRQGSSGDHHLHLEVLGSRTSFTSDLFYDMFGWPAGTRPPTTPPTKPPVPVAQIEEVTMKLIMQKGKPERWKTDGFVREHIKTMAEVAALEAVFGKTVEVADPEAFGPVVTTESRTA
jgi:hypothetical protein